MAGQKFKIDGEVRTTLFSQPFKRLVREINTPMAIPFSAELPPAKTGELTTRTNDTTGTLTMQASHGIATADPFDLFWTNVDGTYGRRRGVIAGTVAGTSVPISGGVGDNLPPLNTDITAMEPQIESLVVDGDQVSAIVADADGEPASARIMDDDDPAVEALAIELDTTKDSYVWDTDSGLTNPLAGKVTTLIHLSHGDATKPVTVRGAVFYG